MSTSSGCVIVYTLFIVYELSLGNLVVVPFVFAVFLRGFIVNENQDSAVNNRCADLLWALSLLFTEKAVSIVFPRQRPHVNIIM